MSGARDETDHIAVLTRFLLFCTDVTEWSVLPCAPGSDIATRARSLLLLTATLRRDLASAEIDRAASVSLMCGGEDGGRLIIFIG